MAYTKQNFQNGKVLTAEQLNYMEDGISEVVRLLGELDTRVAELDARVAELEPSPNLFTLTPEDCADLYGISYDPKTGTLVDESYNYSTQFTKTVGELFPRLVVGKTYTLSFYADGYYSGCTNAEFSIAFEWSRDPGYNEETFTYTEGIKDGNFYLRPFGYEDEFTAWTPNPTTFRNIMLNEGDTALPFEPCDY